MLEALVAIGLAGTVVQFFQCACEFISQTNAIRKTGGPSSLADLRKLTESLTMRAAVIEAQLHAKVRIWGMVRAKGVVRIKLTPRKIRSAFRRLLPHLHNHSYLSSTSRLHPAVEKPATNS